MVFVLWSIILLIRYFLREHAAKAVNLLNNSMLDMRVIRVDWDTGFEEGRQYGRGWSGAQKRDDISNRYDPERPKGFINLLRKIH